MKTTILQVPALPNIKEVAKILKNSGIVNVAIKS
jgi:hypothetical protein